MFGREITECFGMFDCMRSRKVLNSDRSISNYPIIVQGPLIDWISLAEHAKALDSHLSVHHPGLNLTFLVGNAFGMDFN
jgi:hypothetical protein